MKELILKYNKQVPRYTSYPSAPHFNSMAEEDFLSALSLLDPQQSLSLYIHIPFCKEMCWYCGCHTMATRKYSPLKNYTADLIKEINLLSKKIPAKMKVSHLHFGGGSPSLLSVDDFSRLIDSLKDNFDFTPQAEIAIEADPRGITHDRAACYSRNGVTRVSFGLQDFSPLVQLAINRIQSFDCVKKSVEMLKEHDIKNINFDLMYGLPKQTLGDIIDSAEKSLSLRPSRIAHFGYAHVPWMKKHMRLIKEEDLPDAALRIDQFLAAESILCTGQMKIIGLDHFVVPEDDMHKAFVQKTLKRNFQGYSTDSAPAMLGIGASSIGYTEQGFFQNHTHVTQYSNSLSVQKLPIARGKKTTHEDKARAEIISNLMCYLEADISHTLAQCGFDKTFFDSVITDLADLQSEGIVHIKDRTIYVAPKARQLSRLVASRFDAYFSVEEKRHAQAA